MADRADATPSTGDKGEGPDSNPDALVNPDSNPDALVNPDSNPDKHGESEQGLITYVIPCQSCNAFLSLTTATELDQICQACRTPVTPLMELLNAGKVKELPLPNVSRGELVKATCPGEKCGRTSMFPKNFAIYCPVCLEHVLKEHREEPPAGCWEYYTGSTGRWVAGKCDSCLSYISEKPNPLFQIFYICIMCGWFYLYMRFARMEESAVVLPILEQVPGGYWHLRIMEGGFVVGIMLLFQTYYVDPGKVTEDNHEQLMNLYPMPGPLEPPLKWCNTCRLLRPPRSHHCRVCDICVVRFDHHCVWLNTCIAAKNLRWFLAFVGWHALLCIYGAVFTFVLIYHIAVKIAEGDPSVVAWLGQRRIQNYVRFLPQVWGRAAGLIGNVGDSHVPWVVVYAVNVPLMALLLFSVIMAAVLGSFFLVHVLQVLRNQTSYEGWTWQPPPLAPPAEQDDEGATSDSPSTEETPPKSDEQLAWDIYDKYHKKQKPGAKSKGQQSNADAAAAAAVTGEAVEPSDGDDAATTKQTADINCRPKLSKLKTADTQWKFDQGRSANLWEVLQPGVFWEAAAVDKKTK
jgi:hypothetical protein|eukprot:SAG25_NODE_1430_length_3044_cov_4.352122_1_plen_574_part_00